MKYTWDCTPAPRTEWAVYNNLHEDSRHHTRGAAIRRAEYLRGHGYEWVTIEEESRPQPSEAVKPRPEKPSELAEHIMLDRIPLLFCYVFASYRCR